MIMATVIKAVMAGLFATTAFAVVGTSVSAAFSPKDLGLGPTQITQEPQVLDARQAVHKAVWNEQDQRSFWEQEEDRGG
jgi:hypothetical protein